MAHLIDISLGDKPEIEATTSTTALEYTGGGKTLLPVISCPPSVFVENLFTFQEVDEINSYAKNLADLDATTHGGRTDYRVSKSKFFFPNKTNSWIFDRITVAVNGANEIYQFQMTALLEGAQYTTYYAPNGHYGWHVDMGENTPNRKLSVVVQLSDPSEYEGGDLEIWRGGNPVVEIKNKGAACIFPSWEMHRVTEVTSGVRKSLVIWASGPAFR
jgi:PKHD-type hydroxylase